MKEDRTFDDFSDEELDEIEKNDPELYDTLNDNTVEATLDTMYPDEDSRPDDD
jgi:hypothetical protein